MKAAINAVSLTEAQRVFMHQRYLKLVDSYVSKYAYIRMLHIFSKTFITVATVLIPTLLSVVKDANSELGSTLQWLVLALSMAVTIVNGMAELFGISTMYAKYWLTIEAMQSEGWQFIQHTGKYARYSSQSAAFSKFAYNLEKMQHLTVRQLSHLDKKNSEKSHPTKPASTIDTESKTDSSIASNSSDLSKVSDLSKSNPDIDLRTAALQRAHAQVEQKTPYDRQPFYPSLSPVYETVDKLPGSVSGLEKSPGDIEETKLSL